MKLVCPVLATLACLAMPAALPAQVAQPGKAADPESSALSGATTAALTRDDAAIGPTRQPTLLDDQRSGRRAPPFGADLFKQVPPQGTGPILDPAYVLRPGDTVAVNQWGLINNSSQLTVDPKGNIAIPGIGPVQVAGTAAGGLDAKVRSAAQGTYQQGVQIYAAPLSATTLSIFVTGPVVHPGIYAGSSSDSVIGFLQRAGGPDPNRGSYRHIYIRRGGTVVATMDIYAFLTEGRLPQVTLQQGDVIVVGEQGPVVAVTGAARAPFTFELTDRSAPGTELLHVALPRPEVTDVSVLSIRDGKPVNSTLSLSGFAGFRLADGDRVRFEANARSDTYIIQVEGAQIGQTSFVVPRGTRLGTVLDQLKLDPLADRTMIHLRRDSVARTQKQLLDESLARLEKAIYTTPSPTPGVAQARQVDSAGLQQFIARARTIQPEGLVSLQGVDPDQIILEPDDVIVVPFQSQAVVIGGEVALPQSVIAQDNKDARAYIQRAGGFTERANHSQLLVISPDGSAHIGGLVRPGDRVMVPPKVSSAAFDLVKDITTILYQLAVATAAILR